LRRTLPSRFSPIIHNVHGVLLTVPGRQDSRTVSQVNVSFTRDSLDLQIAHHVESQMRMRHALKFKQTSAILSVYHCLVSGVPARSAKLCPFGAIFLKK